MDYRTGYNDGFRAGVEAALRFPMMTPTTVANPFDAAVQAAGGSSTRPLNPVEKPKRKASAYSKAYGRAYRSLRRKNTLKSGKLRKGVTHKKLVKMAHAEAKRSRRSK